MFKQSFKHMETTNIKHLKEISKDITELALDEKGFDKIQIINEKIQKYFIFEKQT